MSSHAWDQPAREQPAHARLAAWHTLDASGRVRARRDGPAAILLDSAGHLRLADPMTLRTAAAAATADAHHAVATLGQLQNKLALPAYFRQDGPIVKGLLSELPEVWALNELQNAAALRQPPIFPLSSVPGPLAGHTHSSALAIAHEVRQADDHSDAVSIVTDLVERCRAEEATASAKAQDLLRGAIKHSVRLERLRSYEVERARTHLPPPTQRPLRNEKHVHLLA